MKKVLMKAVLGKKVIVQWNMILNKCFKMIRKRNLRLVVKRHLRSHMKVIQTQKKIYKTQKYQSNLLIALW